MSDDRLKHALLEALWEVCQEVNPNSSIYVQGNLQVWLTAKHTMSAHVNQWYHSDPDLIPQTRPSPFNAELTPHPLQLVSYAQQDSENELIVKQEITESDNSHSNVVSCSACYQIFFSKELLYRHRCTRRYDEEKDFIDEKNALSNDEDSTDTDDAACKDRHSSPGKQMDLLKADTSSDIEIDEVDEATAKIFEDVEESLNNASKSPKNDFDEGKITALKDFLNKCKKCELTDNQKMAILKQKLEHFVIIINNKKIHKCIMCDKTVIGRNGFHHHLMKHLDLKPYQCSHCDRKFSRKDTLRDHVFTHTKDSPFQCSVCFKTFGRQKSLDMHMHLHKGAQFTCNICGWEMYHPLTYKRHMNEHKTNTFRGHWCHFCQEHIKTKVNYDSHMHMHEDRLMNDTLCVPPGNDVPQNPIPTERKATSSFIPDLNIWNIENTDSDTDHDDVSSKNGDYANEAKFVSSIESNEAETTSRSSNATLTLEHSINASNSAKLKGVKRSPAKNEGNTKKEKLTKDRERSDCVNNTAIDETNPSLTRTRGKTIDLAEYDSENSLAETNEISDDDYLPNFTDSDIRPNPTITPPVKLRKVPKKIHKLVIKDNKKLYQCIECDKVYSGRSALRKHYVKHCSKPQFQCNACGKSFYRKDGLQMHEFTHTKESPFKCTECDKCFLKKHLLDDHMNSHSGIKAHICEVCGKSYISKMSLNMHVKRHTDRDIKCQHPGCERMFFTKSDLTVHYRVHTNERPYTCSHCGMSFKDCSTFRKHEKRHGEAEYMCSFCTKMFHTAAACQRHENMHHINEGSFRCKECDKGFNTKSQLQRHQVIHSGIRAYICKYCGKAFTQSNDCVRHERIHAGVKPYSCSICDRTFTLKNTRDIHLKTHLKNDDQHQSDINSQQMPYVPAPITHFTTNVQMDFNAHSAQYTDF